jgi:dihydrofolate reductase
MHHSKTSSLALIAAVASNGVIGRHNTLPWRLPEDLRRFRQLTLHHRVIMGRKTWESLGKPLPERENVVITRRRDYPATGCRVTHTLEEALQPESGQIVFCIGGAELYRLCLPLAQTLYLTEIDRAYEGDAWFPAFDRAAWREASRETRLLDGPDGFQYHFVVYERAP